MGEQHGESGEASEEAATQQEAATSTEEAPTLSIELAVKIYKTSILVFKDRDRYVSGEFRWRSVQFSLFCAIGCADVHAHHLRLSSLSRLYSLVQGYAKKNPRKMVRTWAEKELRNLARIHASGIPSPRPLLLRDHILVMQFLGHDGRFARRAALFA